MLRGISVSRWQKDVDWGPDGIGKSGLDFAILKIGGADDGLYLDSTFRANALSMSASTNMAMGGYWFFDGRFSANDQANLILSWDKPFTAGVWIDFEETADGSPKTLDDLRKLYTLVMELRRRKVETVGIYTRASFWDPIFSQDKTLARPESLGIPLWVAHYKPLESDTGPIIPQGWSKYAIWQYSSRGRVPGIQGDVTLETMDPNFLTAGKPSQQKGTYKVTASDGLRVRSGPSTDAPIVGMWPEKTVVAGTPENGWLAMDVVVGGARPQGSTGSPVKFFSSMKYLESQSSEPTPVPPPIPTPIPPQPPAPPSTPFLGVNCITDFAAAKDAVSIGAPAVLVMGQKLEAVWLAQANPKVRVIYRSVKPNHNPSVDWMIHSLAPNASDPPIVFMGRNENDEGVGVSPSDLRARADWDCEVARRIKAIQPNATYIAGSFSMGTPALERDDVAQAMRDGYAAAYNSGLLGLDFHLYAPTPAQIWQDPELIWYERRWEMLFTRCGFDPKIRNVWASETGLDQGSVGGFPAHGFTETDLTKFLVRYQEIQSRPVVVGGISYPSPHIGGVIFQYGAEPNWGGYDTRGYRSAFQKFWAK